MRNSTVSGSQTRNYVLESFQWPEGTTTLTWSFATLNIPFDGDRDDLFGYSMAEEDQDIVRQAIAAWEAVCGIDFVEVPDSAHADIRIGWSFYVDGDGAGGNISTTTSWFFGDTTLAVGIVFDPAEAWTDELLYDATLHEIGHAMGIDHSDVRGAVMAGYPTTPYAGQYGRDELTPDDIAAAQALYGSPFGGTDGDDVLIGTVVDDELHGGLG